MTQSVTHKGPPSDMDLSEARSNASQIHRMWQLRKGERMVHHQHNFGRSNAHPQIDHGIRAIEHWGFSVYFFYFVKTASTSGVRRAYFRPLGGSWGTGATKKGKLNDNLATSRHPPPFQNTQSLYSENLVPFIQKSCHFLSLLTCPFVSENSSKNFKHLWQKFYTTFHDISLIRGR